MEQSRHISPENRKSSSNVNELEEVEMRMLCLDSQIGLIVGYRGEIIHTIKRDSSTQITISTRKMHVNERVISIKGITENIAKAFGLIAKSIINNNTKNKKLGDSTITDVHLLVPYFVMARISGEGRYTMDEIIELSAADLRQTKEPLPDSTDMLFTVSGVADSIHIATFYIGQEYLHTFNSMKREEAEEVPYEPIEGRRILGPDTSLLYGEYCKDTRNTLPLQPVTEISIPRDDFLIADYQVDDVYTASPMEDEGTNRKRRRIEAQSRELITRSRYDSFSSRKGEKDDPLASEYPAIPNVRITKSVRLNSSSTSLSEENELLVHVRKTAYIKEEYVGCIIGKGGQNIKTLRNATLCDIEVSDPIEGREIRRVIVKGCPLAVEAALLLIGNSIESWKILSSSRSNSKHTSPALPMSPPSFQ
ncbi:KH domain-containing protein NDAI_0F01960 [Naumovozyma dairenensis CBS 421]|uniref:K Homology domain-containing protein n=1 Tax=Naumovozyma dairenensis (strain ATCC 10597 / BCRC 20456 / CBS 421 / NBRC 0211 / NRRL Y-12639) TaxID=1071378 RepID=G0WCK3_NAUDC|nr:hypothetical protein NDAI_0F01960 [Naumovozyma dairenensis CBS 421]CCD25514.1 hypothetical protein NDAI_0F01960 [Naumovozyma dairenensis CBS 421]